MRYQLAQVNVARAIAPLDAEPMRDFVQLLDAMNALAEVSPGFVWRLKAAEGSTTIQAYSDPLIILNLSVWTSVEALKDYAYKSSHASVFRKRKEWFTPFGAPSLALWWIELGMWPTADEARAKLELLAANGPGPAAFTFKQAFPSPTAR